jgi:hypothetical protein
MSQNPNNYFHLDDITHSSTSDPSLFEAGTQQENPQSQSQCNIRVSPFAYSSEENVPNLSHPPPSSHSNSPWYVALHPLPENSSLSLKPQICCNLS